MLVHVVAGRNTNNVTENNNEGSHLRAFSIVQKEIKTISIIGSGNVAHHLSKALVGECKILSIYSRNHETGFALAEEHFTFFAETLEDLIPADLFLICVNDDSISDIVARLPKDQRIAYTSGAVGLADLPAHSDLGVIYPLQSFSKDQEVNIYRVPFFIEARNNIFAQELFDVAWKLSRTVVFASSEDRKNLHVAAVMVNNFVNHIYALAEDFLRDKKMEFKYLKPLIEETTRKILENTAEENQTGPARRKDVNTIEKHLALTKGEVQDIYRVLSESILKRYQHD